jgi:hypothetical protein
MRHLCLHFNIHNDQVRNSLNKFSLFRPKCDLSNKNETLQFSKYEYEFCLFENRQLFNECHVNINGRTLGL